MNERMEDLFALQSVELELLQIEKAAAESEHVRRVAAATEDVEACARAYARLEEEASTRRRALKAVEDSLAMAEHEAAEIESKLFGGGVQNPRELKSLEERLVAVRRRREKLEEEAIAGLLELDELTRRLGEAGFRLEKARASFDDAKVALEEARAEWTRARKRLTAESGAIRARLPRTLLDTYDSLSRRLGPRAVAKVVDRKCGGCHVALPTSARPEQTGRCPNCGRLLWWVEAAAPNPR